MHKRFAGALWNPPILLGAKDEIPAAIWEEKEKKDGRSAFSYIVDKLCNSTHHL